MSERKADKEAEKAAVLFEEQVNKGLYLDGNKITLSDFMRQFMKDYAEVQLAPKTIEGYRYFIPRIDEAIGHLPIGKIQPYHLQSFYNSLLQGKKNTKRAVAKINLSEIIKSKGYSIPMLVGLSGVSDRTVKAAILGSRIAISSAEAISKALDMETGSIFRMIGDDAKLSPVSIRRYHSFLSSVFQKAVHWQLIAANPAHRAQPPRIPVKEAAYMDDKETEALIAALANEPIKWRTMLMLLLYTGMRRGEVCGLEWKDIDFIGQAIQIRRNAQYIEGMGIITKEPKNKTSQRTMKLPPEIFILLAEYKDWQDKKKLQLPGVWPETIENKGAGRSNN